MIKDSFLSSISHLANNNIESTANKLKKEKSGKKSIAQSARTTGIKVKEAFVAQGYREKANHPDDVNVYLAGTKRLPKFLKKLLRGRSGIEPIIEHL